MNKVYSRVVAYYCDNVLEGLLQNMCRISDDFIFLQDGALVHSTSCCYNKRGDRPTAMVISA